MTIQIDYCVGDEQRSSTWAKFWVHGLNAAKEDQSVDKKSRDYEFCCLDAPEDAMFSIFEQSGNKHGTDTYKFRICRATASAENEIVSSYTDRRYCKGNFEVIAEAFGTTKAPRLMGWWKEKPGDVDPLAYAKLCAAYIDKRGVKDLPTIDAAVKPETKSRQADRKDCVWLLINRLDPSEYAVYPSVKAAIADNPGDWNYLKKSGCYARDQGTTESIQMIRPLKYGEKF